MNEFYYRYYDYRWNNNEHVIQCERFRVVKRTPKGAWIEGLGYLPEKRFILDNARKRFAYPTKELAANSYRIRKEWQIAHCERTLRNAEAILERLKQTPVPEEPTRVLARPIPADIPWKGVIDAHN